MVKNNDSDPIKEVNGNGLFNSLHSFEKNDEYEVEKEIKEYEEAYKKVNETNNINNNRYINNTYNTNTYNYDKGNNRDLEFERKVTSTISAIVVLMFIAIVGVMSEVFNNLHGVDY